MMPPLVFMGSPEFALPTLRLLAKHYKVVGVVTQPDRPSGRGRILTPPPVKLLSLELGLPVIQPRKLRDPGVMQQLSDWAPGLIIVAAFGQILRPEVLNLPNYGCINVHASILPRWRGAAPVQAAILNGDELTGITIMKMDPGIDTGPILSQVSCPILLSDNSESLTARLSGLGAELLLKTLPAYLSGELHPQAQDEPNATYAPLIKKGDGQLDFSQSAASLERKVRAFNPWPGSYTVWKNQLLKLHRTHIVDCPTGAAGKRVVFDGLPAVTTGDGILVIDQLQPAGKNIQSGKAFLQGAWNWAD